MVATALVRSLGALLRRGTGQARQAPVQTIDPSLLAADEPEDYPAQVPMRWLLPLEVDDADNDLAWGCEERSARVRAAEAVLARVTPGAHQPPTALVRAAESVLARLGPGACVGQGEELPLSRARDSVRRGELWVVDEEGCLLRSSCAVSEEDTKVQKRDAEPFGVRVVTLSGDSHEISGLIPFTRLGMLRGLVAQRLSWPQPLVTLCCGDQVLKATSDACPLSDLGIGEGSVVTAVRATGHVLGSGRFALTSRRCSSDEDLAAAVREEFGPQASVADFRELRCHGQGALNDFVTRIGSHGGAFLLNNGRMHYGDGRGGHFFICRHSGSIPRKWLVDSFMADFIDGDEDLMISMVDLCWKSRGSMVVLAELGPA